MCDEHHRVEQAGKNDGTADGGHEYALCSRAGRDAENQDEQIQADEDQCADECDDPFYFFPVHMQILRESKMSFAESDPLRYCKSNKQWGTGFYDKQP